MNRATLGQGLALLASSLCELVFGFYRKVRSQRRVS
jgi:hypothetical protein